MRKIVRRLLQLLELVRLTALSTIFSIAGAVTAITLKHLLDTPQPLESILPGEAHLYRWQHGHIFYKELGKNDAPPILLLHTLGIDASSHEMRNIMKPLTQMYHVYALDLLGFGLSDRPRLDYTAETYIDLLHDFLTDIVEQPATLLASQYSSAYALAIAQRFPKLCERLILISPQTEPEKGALSSLAKIPGLSFVLYALLTTRLALDLTLRQQHQEKSSVSDKEYRYATTHRFGAEHAPLAHLAGKLTPMPSEQAVSIQQPNVIFLGEYGLASHQTRIDTDSVSTQTRMICIPNVGTAVHEQHPEGLIEHIRAWSQKIVPVQKLAPVEKYVPAQETTLVEQPAPVQQSIPVVEAYCVKCKKETVMRDPREVTMKNGRPAVQRTCSICGAGQYRIGKLSLDV